MKTFNILRYGLMKRFKRGIKLTIVLTFRCELNCDYCSVKIPTGKIPKVKEATLNELKNFVLTFPLKIGEVEISGGSPEQHKDFLPFTNWLLESGYFVQLYSNLRFPKIIQQIKKTHRFMIVSTYHHHDNKDRYAQAYNTLSRDYQIIVDEISYQVFSFSKVKPYIQLRDMKNNYDQLRVSPDLRIFTNCYDLSDY